ncbi:MAG: exodeoxyribonuclease VII large subunit, partial [Candidatus Fimimonas sp.]
DVHKLQNRIALLKTQTENALSRLSSANPTNVLKRGFAIVEKDGKKVLSAKQVACGDNLTITVADGKIDAVVK